MRWEQMQRSMSDFFGSDTVYAKESRTYTVASAAAVTGSILILIFRLLFGTVQILLSTLWWTIYCLHIDPYLSVCWFVFNAFSLSVLWYWLISIVTVPLLLSNGPMGEGGRGIIRPVFQAFDTQLQPRARSCSLTTVYERALSPIVIDISQCTVLYIVQGWYRL